jgi:hypothetical protein
MDDYNFFDELFDIINTQPLTTSRFTDYEDTIRVNQQIINNISNIRRHFQYSSEYITEDEENDQYDEDDIVYTSNDLVNQNYNLNNINNIQNTFINDLFNIFNQTINETIDQEFEDVKVTLTPEQFSQFKNIKITNENINQYSSKPCNICMDNYNIDEELTFLVCNHYFHTDCIKHWLCNEKVTCPICRKDNRE